MDRSPIVTPASRHEKGFNWALPNFSAGRGLGMCVGLGQSQWGSSGRWFESSRPDQIPVNDIVRLSATIRVYSCLTARTYGNLPVLFTVLGLQRTPQLLMHAPAHANCRRCARP